MSLSLTTSLVAFFVGIYGVISTTELLSRKKILSNAGVLCWDIFSLQFNQLLNKRVLKIIDKVCEYPQILFLLYIRLISCIPLILIIELPGRLLTFSMSIFSVTNLIISFRNRYGNDGSDQMALIVSTALALGLISHNPDCLKYSLYFIAFQGILAYSTAGLAKLSSKQWRTGLALKYLIGTQTYGHRWLEQKTNTFKHLPIILSWGVILFLSCFLIFFVIGGQTLLVGLLFGMLFHFGNAIFMRLHTFIWSFLATYPAIIFIRSDIHNILLINH